MTALPATTEAFATSATEAQFKTFLAEQRAFLAGLLGTTGLPSDARTALEVSALPARSDGAEMIFTWITQSGQSYYWGSNDGVTMFPVPTANMPVNAHSHAYVPTNAGAGGVGSFVYSTVVTIQSVAFGAAVEGYRLCPAGNGTTYNIFGGTWLNVGGRAAAGNAYSTFQRIA